MTKPYNYGKGKCAAFLRDLIGHRGKACVKWPYGIDRRLGRGQLGYNGEMWKAHRLMCFLEYVASTNPEAPRCP